MRNLIITITSNDLSISYGPSVHYLELWNAFSQLSDGMWDIVGLSPCWAGKKKSIIKSNFKLKRISVPDIKKLRQVVYDMMVAFYILRYRIRGATFYVRLSHFHLFSYWMLRLTRAKYFLELNGIMANDMQSAKSHGSWMVQYIIWQEKKLIQYAKGVIAVSQKIADNAARLNKNVLIIKNRVSERFFFYNKSVKKDRKKLTGIYVGTFTSWDGAEFIPELAKQQPDVEFIMVGDGERRANIERSAPDNVKCLGWVPYADLLKYYSDADFGIVLYEFERHKKVELTSLKTLEYLATGLPVYTTHISGQEFIEENRLGLCVFQGCEISGLADFLHNLDEYTRNVESYRWNKKAVLSWKGAAAETKEFLVKN